MSKNEDKNKEVRLGIVDLYSKEYGRVRIGDIPSPVDDEPGPFSDLIDSVTNESKLTSGLQKPSTRQ
jgi:hypothetical protein